MVRSRPTHALTSLLESSARPVYALNDRREIVFCNRPCLAWLGVSDAGLVGLRCDYALRETGTLEQRAAAALCPPPQAFQGETVQGWVTWTVADGQVEQRPGTFLPLRPEEGAAVLAVLGEPRPLPQPTSDVVTGTAEELHQRLQKLLRRMRGRYRLDGLVGESPQAGRLRDQVSAAIASRSRVLLVGPSGSGREHLARTIVYADPPEGQRSLLPFECRHATLDALLAVVTAAERRLPGAAGGSAAVLLLEVDQLPPAVQGMLAGWLRESPATRLLATAQQRLTDLAAAGRFDRELAWGLSTLVIEVPSLRERREDIPLLAQRLVEEYNASGGRQLAGFSPGAMDRLAALPWPGNLDELASVVRECCQQVSGVWIGEADLPDRVKHALSAGLHPRRRTDPIDLDAFLLEVERELVERALQRAGGNKAAAARMLGVSRARIIRRLQQWGLASVGPTEAVEIDFQPVEEDDEGEAETTK